MVRACEAREMRERRDLKFEDPKTSNFGPRTLPPSRSSRLSRCYTTDGFPFVSSLKLGRYRPKNEDFLLCSFPEIVPLTAVFSPMSCSVPRKYHCPIVVLHALIVSGFPWSRALLAVP